MVLKFFLYQMPNCFTNSMKKMYVKSAIFIIIGNISVWMNAYVWLTSEVHSNQGKLIEKLKDGIAVHSSTSCSYSSRGIISKMLWVVLPNGQKANFWLTANWNSTHSHRLFQDCLLSVPCLYACFTRAIITHSWLQTALEY